MTDFVQQHFAKHPLGADGETVRPVIECADGYTLSVQASRIHYCSPRDDQGPWTSVEVWGFRTDGRHTTEEPEGWVPVKDVNRRIARHGGILTPRG